MNENLRRSSAHVFVRDLSSPVLDDEDAHHLSRVLRLRSGEHVSVSDGAGSWRMCEWRDGELLAVGDIVAGGDPGAGSRRALAVALSPVKGDRTESAVEKLVEIGIDRIIVLAPVSRSVVKWDAARTASNIERWRRIARAAASQSRRTVLPVIEGPGSLQSVLAAPGAALAEPGGREEFDGITTVVIGPEGGFSADEVATAQRTVGLGPSVLRAETAAVVAATLLVAHSRR